MPPLRVRQNFANMSSSDASWSSSSRKAEGEADALRASLAAAREEIASLRRAMAPGASAAEK